MELEPAEASDEEYEDDEEEADAEDEGRSGKTAAELDHDELLYEAGLFLIARERVAVSMVQREFDMSFQEATNLLDELQGQGLIGPYLGGRKRDILLTREEWTAKAHASS